MTQAQTQIKTLLGENFSTIQTLSTIRIKYRTMGFYIGDKEFYAIMAISLLTYMRNILLTNRLLLSSLFYILNRNYD